MTQAASDRILLPSRRWPLLHPGRSRATTFSVWACLLVFAFFVLARPAVADPESPEGRIVGTLLSRVDGLPLEGAVVELQETGTATVADAEGRFVFAGLSPGTYTLEVRLVGVPSQTIPAVLVKEARITRLTIRLEATGFLPENVVTPSSFTLYEERPRRHMGLSREAVNRTPHIASDVYRFLERLPGTTGEEISADVNVRGGETNESLLVVDGVEVYNGLHMREQFGLFGVLDADAVGRLTLVSGGFPAEYGNRMSSVILVDSSKPRDSKRTSLSASFFDLGVLSEGPFDDGRGQWLFTASRTHLDAFLSFINPESGIRPVFLDVLGSVRYQPWRHTWLSLSALGAHDNMWMKDVDGELKAHDNNANVWLSVQTDWRPGLSSHTVLSCGRAEKLREGWVSRRTVDGEARDEGSFDFVGLKQDWALVLGHRHQLRWGFDLRKLRAEYDYLGRSIVRDPLFATAGHSVVRERDIELSPSGGQYGAYVAGRLVAAPVVAEAGLRWDRQVWADDEQLSPRLNLGYKLAQRTTLRAAWGRYHQPQYLQELQVADGVTTFFPAQLTNLGLIGIEHSFPKGFHARVEAYYKDVSRVRPRFENQLNPITALPEIEPDRILVDPDRSAVKGVEVTLSSGGGGRLSWWLSYAYARAEDGIAGEWVPRSWDQPHTVGFSVNWRRADAWDVNLAGVYHTGWPTTAVLAETREASDGTPYVHAALGPRNRERYKDYLRLDLRASGDLPVRRGSLRLYVDVVNLLGRENVPRLTDLSYTVAADGTPHVEETRESYLGSLLNVGVHWTF